MFFVYETVTGRLHSSGVSQPAPHDILSANGLTAIEIADVPDQWVWDPVTHTVSEKTAEPVPLSVLDFLRRLQAAERIAIRASIDPVVVDFVDLLYQAQEVRLDDPDTLAGVSYMEQQGLLSSGRAAEILTP